MHSYSQSPNVQVNSFFKSNRINFHDTNNLSGHIQTYNDERQDRDQREYDKEFEGMELNENSNNVNDFEINEEMKHQLVTRSKTLKMASNLDTPNTSNNTPSYFLEKKSSVDHLAFGLQTSSPRNNYMTRVRDIRENVNLGMLNYSH